MLNNSFEEDVVRDGTIVVGTNGVVNISIPFTATITPSGPGNCGLCIDASVSGNLNLFAPNGVDFVGGDDFFRAGIFGNSGGSSSISGALNFSDTGLAPGTYHFEASLFNDVTFVPEPNTYLLLGVGVLGLAGVSFRKRLT